MAPESSQILQRSTHPTFNLVLIVKILPRFMMVDMKDNPCWPDPKRQKQKLRCRTYLVSSGILTAFPFLQLQLGVRLGPTNPWLICIAKEPLPFQWKRF